MSWFTREDRDMAKRLPVPPELEHLVEKRDEEADRRKSDRRSKQTGDGEEAAKAERRKSADRRNKRRRKSG
jgi:hypothetical protein